jgi:hypothetical protein
VEVVGANPQPEEHRGNFCCSRPHIANLHGVNISPYCSVSATKTLSDASQSETCPGPSQTDAAFTHCKSTFLIRLRALRQGHCADHGHPCGVSAASLPCRSCRRHLPASWPCQPHERRLSHGSAESVGREAGVIMLDWPPLLSEMSALSWSISIFSRHLEVPNIVQHLYEYLLNAVFLAA